MVVGRQYGHSRAHDGVLGAFRECLQHPLPLSGVAELLKLAREHLALGDLDAQVGPDKKTLVLGV